MIGRAHARRLLPRTASVWGAGALVAGSTLALAWRVLLAERQTVDDVFIFLRYARNLATSGEFTFSVGRERVEGASSLVWTALLALAHRAGAGGLAHAKALSFALGLLVPVVCAVAVGFSVRRAPAARVWLLAVPAVALAVDADLAVWIASGMDTALWALACVVCVALAAWTTDAETSLVEGGVAALALGMLSWVRPEGALFAGAGVAGLARSPRSLLHLAALAALPVGLVILARAAYFHDVVPNTVWAKMHSTDGRDYTGAAYIASALARRPILLVAVPALRLALCRRRPLGPGERVALALLGSAFALAFVAGGDWMPNRRLLVVALPLASIVAACALARASAPVVALAALALGGEGLMTTDRALDQTWRARESLDERVEEWMPRAAPFVDRYPLDWMPAHLLQEVAPYVGRGDTVSHVDMGQLPYVMSDVAFLDGFGLVDRAAARLTFAPGDPARRLAVVREFFAADPAAVITVLDVTTGRPFSAAQSAALDDPRFLLRWREVSRVPTWGGNMCVVYVRRNLPPAAASVAAERIRTWLRNAPELR